jgi:hypothetical protein
MKETTMNALNSATKMVTCGFGAVAISMIMSWSVVTSTAVVPFATASTASHVRMAGNQSRPHRLVLAKSGPAVLVD